MLSQDNILLIGGCGYIGSFLYHKLREAGFTVTVCDYLERGNPNNIDVLQCDYAELDQSMLQQFGAILWFGGHSSVSQSVAEPHQALINNCLNLYNFAQKLHQDTKFIYASTGSIYSTKNRKVVPATESEEIKAPSDNAYDISKFSFDYLAENFLNNYYALRMGTLAGYSPNIRKELVFNAMNLSAVMSGKIHLSNQHASRTILFLDDLWLLIFKLLSTEQDPGILNAGSFSCSIGELAKAIADTWNVDIVDHGNTQTYSFILDTTRMEKICGDTIQTRTINQRCHDLIYQLDLGNTKF